MPYPELPGQEIGPEPLRVPPAQGEIRAEPPGLGDLVSRLIEQYQTDPSTRTTIDMLLMGTPLGAVASYGRGMLKPPTPPTSAEAAKQLLQSRALKAPMAAGPSRGASAGGNVRINIGGGEFSPVEMIHPRPNVPAGAMERVWQGVPATPISPAQSWTQKAQRLDEPVRERLGKTPTLDDIMARITGTSKADQPLLKRAPDPSKLPGPVYRIDPKTLPNPAAPAVGGERTLLKSAPTAPAVGPPDRAAIKSGTAKAASIQEKAILEARQRMAKYPPGTKRHQDAADQLRRLGAEP